MSIFFEILLRITSYGPKIGQSHGENRLRHILKSTIALQTFHLIKDTSVTNMDSRVPFRVYSVPTSLVDYFNSRPGLSSTRSRWPVASLFFSRATRKCYFFHKNPMLGVLDFTSSEYWAPFNFS